MQRIDINNPDLSFIKDKVYLENVKKVLILSGQDNDTEDKAKSLLDKFDSSIAGATDSWLAFKDYQGCIKTHFFPTKLFCYVLLTLNYT